MEIKLGEKIRHRRKQLGLTLKDIAGDIVTPSQISAIEKGKCKPSNDLLLHIARCLDTDIEYFTLSEEEKHRKLFDCIKDNCKNQIDSGEYDAAFSTLENAEHSLGHLNYMQKGQFHYLRGECYYLQRKYFEGFNCYINALGYILKTKEINTTADVYIKIANCLFNSSKPDIALGYYLKAYDIMSIGVDEELTARILFNLSVCYLKLQRYDLCKKFIIECLCFLVEQDEATKKRFYPGLRMLIGVVNVYRKGFMNSNKIFEKAFENYKSTMDLFGMGRAMHNNGVYLYLIGDYEGSAECYKQAIEYKSRCSDDTLINTFINLINMYKETSSTEKVIESINNAEEKMIETNSTSGLIDIFIIKFEYYSMLKQYDRAEIFAFLALDNVEKVLDTKKEFDIYIKLADMYRKVGDNSSSAEYVIKAKSLIV
jgi:HTH-type transcriptional regulator, quorum sensing regulator NprR